MTNQFLKMLVTCFLDKAVEMEQKAFKHSKEIKDVNGHKWKGKMK
jgi:hypothetical protein